jgi:Tol biopolymer transport system component
MVFSPDGQWVTYRSDKSGRPERYVQRFTGSSPIPEDGQGGPYQISTGGSWGAWWSPDGKEVRYYDLDQNVMSVTVQTTPTFSATVPKKLYSIKDLHAYSTEFVADGRILAVLLGEGEQTTQIDLVLNFFEELKQRMGEPGK